MKGPCRICLHEHRAEIDAALVLGKPLRLVASEFGVARSTLGRHAKAHVRERAAKSLERVTVAFSRHLQSYMRTAQETVISIMKEAKTRGDTEAALRAAQQVRENTECMRKLLIRTADAKPKQGVEAEIPKNLAARMMETYEAHEQLSGRTDTN